MLDTNALLCDLWPLLAFIALGIIGVGVAIYAAVQSVIGAVVIVVVYLLAAWVIMRLIAFNNTEPRERPIDE